MSVATHSRRRFVALAGATSTACVLGLPKARTANANDGEHAINCALVHMRRLDQEHAPQLMATAAIRRMCQLMDECNQWGSKIDLIVFTNLKDMRLAADSIALEALYGEANALESCLSFGCTLTTRDGDHASASIFIDPITGITTHPEQHESFVLRQIDAVPSTAPHDHIQYAQLSATMMNLIRSPMDSFAAPVG